MTSKKVQKRDGGTKESTSARPNAIVLAALELFTRYGYRKTSIDDIAQAAQVAKRTVYLHFENKAAVFLAILESYHWGSRFVRSKTEGFHGAPASVFRGGPQGSAYIHARDRQRGYRRGPSSSAAAP